MQLADEVGRLANALERGLELTERREREQQAMALAAQWSTSPPPRLGLRGLLLAIPGLAARFDHVVPDEFIAQTGDDEITVACPCAESPTLRTGRLQACACGRWFLHDGNEVHVARLHASAAA